MPTSKIANRGRRNEHQIVQIAEDNTLTRKKAGIQRNCLTPHTYARLNHGNVRSKQRRASRTQEGKNNKSIPTWLASFYTPPIASTGMAGPDAGRPTSVSASERARQCASENSQSRRFVVQCIQTLAVMMNLHRTLASHPFRRLAQSVLCCAPPEASCLPTSKSHLTVSTRNSMPLSLSYTPSLLHHLLSLLSQPPLPPPPVASIFHSNSPKNFPKTAKKNLREKTNGATGSVLCQRCNR